MDEYELKEHRYRVLYNLMESPSTFVKKAYQSNIFGFPTGSKYFKVDEDYCYIPNGSNQINLLTNQISGNIRKKYLLERSNVLTYMNLTRGSSTQIPSIYNQCLPMDSTNLNFIGSDDFTHEVLVAYWIDYIFNQEGLNLFGLNTYLKYHLGFICDGVGYRLMENPDLGLLNENMNILGDPDNILEVIKQVVLTLNFLQTNYVFTNSMTTINNLYVSSKPINVQYKNIVLNSNFTCKLSNYKNSSLNYKLRENENPYRFFNRKWEYTNTIYWYPFDPKINSNYFNLEPSIEDYYLYSRYMEIPYFPQVDIYTFLISMLMVPDTFELFFSDPEMVNNIWLRLWDKEEEPVANEKLEQLVGSQITEETIYNYLKNFKLKCNINKELMYYLAFF